MSLYEKHKLFWNKSIFPYYTPKGGKILTFKIGRFYIFLYYVEILQHYKNK